MLQLFHKYKRSLVGFTILFLMALSLSGLALDAVRTFGNHSQRNYAIKVNDQEISFQDFSKISKNSRQDPQAVVDRTVAGTLLEQTAKNHGFNAGPDSVTAALDEQLFRGHYSRELYEMVLQQSGMTPRQFENMIRTEALRNQFTQLLSDVSFASDNETRTHLTTVETKYGADYLSFDPKAYLPKAKEPTDGEVTSYYNDHGTDFEVAAGVQYDYVLFTPAQYEKEVAVSPDDIELYYTDNESDFATPESVKARVIRLDYPKKATEAQKTEVKEKANQALARAKAGESFETLALELSDDLVTKTKGGLLDWTTRGKQSKGFDEAAFKLKAPGLGELAEDPTGFQVIKVEEYKAAGTKPLAEVKDQIIAAIQKREAPAYALSRSQDLLEEWLKGKSSLADFASSHGLKVASTNGILTKDVDPEADAKGLTAAVLPIAEEPRQLADFESSSALVQVNKNREPNVAPVAEVRGTIVERLKLSEAKTLARSDAQRILDLLSKPETGSLADLAGRENITKQSVSNLQRNKMQEGLFANPELSKAVFSASKAGQKPAKVIEVNGIFYLIQTTTITPPVAEDVEKKLVESKEEESQRIANTFIMSVVNQLKHDATIDVNPQVLAVQEGSVEG